MNARDSMTTTAKMATIERDKMSDGSIAYNVLVDIHGQEIRFACQTAGHAAQLESNINACSWTEVI